MGKKKISKEQQQQIPEENSVGLKPIGDVTKDAFLDFGWYINNRRHMASLQDGLKISYRRLIYTAMTFPRHPFNPTNTLIAAVQKYHPHGISSMNDMAAVLVKSGIFAGKGSFGYTQIDGVVNPAANERYTHIAISDLYWEIMGDLIKEVPYIESPQGSPEPTYIPTPLPISLYLKTASSGLGVGVSMSSPCFSPQSMYLAYINNDPSLLEPNVDLILDKKNSDLAQIWNTGKGKITYWYKTSRTKSADGKIESVLFETKDGTEIFTPKLKKLRKLEEEGKIMIDDLTDINSAKLLISRIPGARGITIDDIEKLCIEASVSTSTYNLNITDGQTTYRIPLKDWIDFTYKNYVNLVSQVNQKKIEKCKFDIAVQTAIPVIGHYISSVNPKATDAEISSNLNISPDVVKEVMEKPISYLRDNKDTSERVKNLKNKLKELKAFDAVKFTEQVISKL